MFTIRSLATFAAIFTTVGLFVAPAAVSAPPGTLPFGAYDPEGYYENDPELSIEHVFMPWEDVDLSTLVAADEYALLRKRVLLITVEPWTWTRSERNTRDFLLVGIRDGIYDENMRRICAVLATLESPVSVRWAHEMEHDDGQFTWAGWEPDDYILAYRRMIDICRAELPNANFVWSPLGLENAVEYYPGEEYVDIVGMSVFGFEPWEIATQGRTRTYEEILVERYDRLASFEKPIIVAEVGYSGTEPYVNLWESQVRQARPELPLLVGAVYFNQVEVYPWPDGFGLPDWRVKERILP